MGRLRATSIILALLLAALALGACGGGSSAKLLPGTTASQINRNLEQVRQSVSEGNCEGAEDATAAVSTQVGELGSGVDGELKAALAQGAERLGEVVEHCEDSGEGEEEELAEAEEQETLEEEGEEEEQAALEEEEQAEEKERKADEKEEKSQQKEEEKEQKSEAKEEPAEGIEEEGQIEESEQPLPPAPAPAPAPEGEAGGIGPGGVAE